MYKCNKCYHQFSGTPDSLACCNVCENGDQFLTITEEEYDGEENFVFCPVCGVLTTGYGACYNCGYDAEECEPGDFEEDWIHPNDKPYEEEE